MSELKKGYTTGTCAAACAKAGAIMILGGIKTESINVVLPDNKILNLKIENISINKDYVVCSVKKYSGDDPDITNGIYIYSKVSLCNSGINITGGTGIGKVTRDGLDQPVGEYAINSVPRKCIEQNIKEVCDFYGYKGGINIEIYAPEGVEIAKKTFNPRLGIVGGISILGTSGIVEPMSEKALIDTIKTEINVVSKKHDYIVTVPGNYGADFAVNNLGIDRDKIVTMSNFVGETIDIARSKGVKGLLLIGHIGKMVKLGGGIMNTHSKYADCRMDIIAACGIKQNIDCKILKDILNCVTTDEAVDLLTKNDIIDNIMSQLIKRIDYYTKLRADEMEIGTIVFSNKYGILCQSDINMEKYR